jgi:hypothetical protein
MFGLAALQGPFFERRHHGILPLMPSRASRGGKRADPIQNALRVVEESTGEVLKPAEGKNPHAQALSALGAAKGGKARAAKLSAEKRRAIARKAAKARWRAKS